MFVLPGEWLSGCDRNQIAGLSTHSVPQCSNSYTVIPSSSYLLELTTKTTLEALKILTCYPNLARWEASLIHSNS